MSNYECEILSSELDKYKRIVFIQMEEIEKLKEENQELKILLEQ